MGFLIAIIGILVFFFFNSILGGVIFIVGIIIEILVTLGKLGDILNNKGITNNFINWLNNKTTAECVMLGVGVVVIGIIIATAIIF